MPGAERALFDEQMAGCENAWIPLTCSLQSDILRSGPSPGGEFVAPRKWGDEGHGLGEPAPAPEPPRNGDDARKLDQHPLKEQIMAWQRIADAAKAKKKT